jgi:hypothetical protein
MPSLVWDRDPEEAFKNPYEYEIQKQFVRESTIILEGFHKLMDKRNLRYPNDDISLEKALWILNYDSLDALQDCLEMLQIKKHKLAGRLFRDVWETIELANYFNRNTEKSRSDLTKWFNNEIISHSRVRDQIKKLVSTYHAKEKASYYRDLSQFTHRSYKAILKGYSLGRDNVIVNDSHSRTGALVLPHVISSYYACLASLIKYYSASIVECGSASKEDVDEVWKNGLEKETIERRFAQE